MEYLDVTNRIGEALDEGEAFSQIIHLCTIVLLELKIRQAASSIIPEIVTQE